MSVWRSCRRSAFHIRILVSRHHEVGFRRSEICVRSTRPPAQRYVSSGTVALHCEHSRGRRNTPGDRVHAHALLQAKISGQISTTHRTHCHGAGGQCSHIGRRVTPDAPIILTSFRHVDGRNNGDRRVKGFAMHFESKSGSRGSAVQERLAWKRSLCIMMRMIIN